MSVTMAEGFPRDFIERIANDQIDVAFIRTPVTNLEGVVIERLLEESMVVALPSGHALAQGKSGNDTALSLKALAGESFILYGRPHGALTMQSSAITTWSIRSGFSGSR